MNLKDQRRISTPECFVCRWAGSDIVIWPQEPKERPTEEAIDSLRIDEVIVKAVAWTSGTWKCYVKVEPPIPIQVIHDGTLRSKHREIEVCGLHWFALEQVWVQIAWWEVALDYLWNQYIERMER